MKLNKIQIVSIRRGFEMPTNIIESNQTGSNRTLLRVTGDMILDDAVLLEKIALGMREESGRDIVIDLADLDFLDSDSAPILKRLEKEHGFEISGMEIFIQTAVNDVEKRLT